MEVVLETPRPAGAPGDIPVLHVQNSVPEPLPLKETFVSSPLLFTGSGAGHGQEDSFSRDVKKQLNSGDKAHASGKLFIKSFSRYFRERKKHIKKKTRKHNFHGIVPGFWGEFCLCVFFSPIRNDPKKKTHKQIFGTHPVPGQSRKFVYVDVFFLSLILAWASQLIGGDGITISGRGKCTPRPSKVPLACGGLTHHACGPGISQSYFLAPGPVF